MSFPFQRFFSLSSSTNNASSTAQAAPTVTAPTNTSKLVDQNSLDLLVRAASGGGGGTPASLGGNANSGGNNSNDMNNGISHSMGATPVDSSQGQGADGSASAPTATPTMDNTNNNLQQAFLQSMASQQAQGVHPSAIFGAPSTANAGGMNLAGAPGPAAQQFGQLFGNMTSPQGNIVGAPGVQAGAPQDASQSQAGAPSAAAGGQQGNMISQLVASLQAQQQAQQQAQVQAALVRAFGPGANTGNLATAGAANPMAAIQAQASAPGTQGMAGGIQGLNTSMATSQAGSLQQNTAARDLLSRMQLAQSVQQQQQVQQAQQQVQQAQQQQQAAQQHQQQQATSNTTFDATKAATATAISAGNATADDLIKLQFEQERHNRMLQMVQADRQERAMLANQEALMKKHRKSDGGSNVGDLTAVTMNDAVKNMFNQFPNANTLVANAAAAGFPNAASSLLTANGLKLPGLNQNLANNLQTGLINAATGLPNLAGLGGVGGDATIAVEQHLHQKLGSARGAAIVPCRARGMPVDHNFKTAYFVIPDGIEHGDELMCSYPACRQAGVKFRYCLHCKVPVAKRNFRNRHRHGVPGGDGASASDVEEESEEEEETTENVAQGSKPVDGDICKPAAASAKGGEDEDDYSGVKKEHVFIIPGANTAAQPMKKKKKKSGNVRVPCRARGMPMAHNFKTAYFIIPPTIEHGDELLCSFPSCRSAGAKFRYCLHCKVPVAKRNFRNRHKHGNMGGLDKKKSASGNLKSPEGSNDDQKAKAEEGTKSNESSMPELPNAKTEESEKPVEEDAKPSSEPEPAASNETEAAAAAAADAEEEDGKVTISSSHDANKVQKWVELLENKPNPSDKQAMAVWMLNLMNATEGGVPPVAAAPAASASTTAELQVEEPPVKEEEEAEDDEEEDDSSVAKAEDNNESKPPADGVEGAVDSTGKEEGLKRDVDKAEEENDAASTVSSSSQPPKKKFKQEFEEV